MSTLTPRLQFTKPAPADLMNNWDAEVMNVWEKLDNYYGCREVATVGSAFFIGEIVNESSTDTYKRWDGAAWKLIGRRDTYADSYETSAAETDTFSFTTGTNAVIYGAPFDVFQDHYYRISFCGQVEWALDATVGEINLQIRVRATPGGLTVISASQLVREFSYQVDSQSTIATPTSGSAVYHHTTADSKLSVGIFGIGDGSNDWHINASPGAGGGLKPSTQLIVHDCGRG